MDTLGRPPIRPPRRVTVVGHDFKFFALQAAALRAAGATVRFDVWTGHDGHDEAATAELRDWAEVVVAAWCLGGAVWYSRHRRPEQRLIVQLHRFELDTPHPGQVAADRVNVFCFPGPHVRDQALADYGWPAEAALYLPNPVDTAALDRPKAPDARFTLGLLGYDRALKRLDLALDLLVALRRDDERFRLVVRGQPGRGDPEYFARQDERIATDPLLAGAVTREDFDADVAGWFTRIGHVLSLSDVESFHLALAEGMASRAVPLIRRRDGAAQLWPAEWIHDDVPAMAEAVLGRAADDWQAAGERARAFVEAHYDARLVTPLWCRLAGVAPEGAGARDATL